MSTEHDDLRPREERVQKLVQGLSQPTANESFRAALKTQFVSGAIPERPAARTPRTARRIHWIGVATPLVAAAAILLMIGIFNRGAGWSYLEGEGQATIDGVTVSLDDLEAVQAQLRPGVIVELDVDSRACFQQGDMVLAELTSGSQVTLPNLAGRWWGKSMHGRVHAGVVRWVTGPAFPGHSLSLTTPESLVEVTGTCFTLMCTESGTCVCVLEGDVEVVDAIAGRDLVHGGHRKTMFRTGAPPDYGDMHENERSALTRLALLVEEQAKD